MDDSLFLWENGGQEQQRHPPHVNQAALGDFRFSASIPLEPPSILLEPPVNPSGYGNPAPPLPPDLFSSAYTSHAASATFQHEFTAPTLWDAAPSSWLPHSAQQLSQTPPRWDDASGQPHRDDFVSSSRSAPAYLSSTMDSSRSEFSSDDYGIDLLMGDFRFFFLVSHSRLRRLVIPVVIQQFTPSLDGAIEHV
ncbi:hypothetical protein B0H14DRAFT_3431263 [Mycena olivaceomarginata]|nr:hypothetical protein B0H14DRAFT_3431263 [Mycena olivaceomarginata]